jgi:hypothetical protein
VESGRYAAFVAALEEGSRDNLEYVKERALAAAAALLRAKPEAEAALMSLLVNKLGDPLRKLASKVLPASRCPACTAAPHMVPKHDCTASQCSCGAAPARPSVL